MNRSRDLMLRAGLAVFLLAAVLPVAVHAMDAEELIAKHLEAQGGVEKLQAVQTQQTTAKFMTQGMEFPIVITQQRPKKMHVDVAVMGMQVIQAYDGTTAWAINPMASGPDPQPMGGLEAIAFPLQADMDGLLVEYEKKGYTVEYLGEGEVEGTPVYKLRVDTGLGIVNDLNIDQDYFLLIMTESKIVYEGDETVVQTFQSDFQEVDGLVLPFFTESRSGDTVLNQMATEKVEFGVEVDETIFTMPEKTETAGEPGKPE